MNEPKPSSKPSGSTEQRNTKNPDSRLKHANLSWLDSFPENWTLPKIGWKFDVELGKMLDEKQIEGEQLEPYLRNKDVQWWEINTKNLPEMDFSPEEKRKYSLQRGDVLVCEGGEIGRSAVWTDDNTKCYYQKALHRVRPRDTEYSSRYFCYFMEYAAKSGIFSSGANQSTIEHLTVEKLKNQYIPLPPADEQHIISDFLDRHRKEIDAAQSLLGDLKGAIENKKQRVIHRSVTGSYESTESTVNSGEDWIGQIPKHWDVVRTRFVARLESGHTPSRSNDEYWENCNIPWVTTSDIKPFRKGRKIYLDETEHEISQLGLDNSGARLLPEGTVFLSRTASVGFSGIMGQEMATSQDFANWVCGDKILPEYLLYVFRSMSQEFNRLTQGSTHQTIYMPDIKSFKTPLPPLEEQREIVDYIQTETERLWELIEKIERTIELLEEKRKALITAAVTGQIDVTEAQGIAEEPTP